MTRVSKSENAIEVYYQHSTFEKRKTSWKNRDLYFSSKYTCILIIMHFLSSLTDWCYTITSRVMRFITLPHFKCTFGSYSLLSVPLSPHLLLSAHLSPHHLGSSFSNPNSFWMHIWALTTWVVRFITLPPFECVFEPSSLSKLFYFSTWVGHPL